MQKILVRSQYTNHLTATEYLALALQTESLHEIESIFSKFEAIFQKLSKDDEYGKWCIDSKVYGKYS